MGIFSETMEGWTFCQDPVPRHGDSLPFRIHGGNQPETGDRKGGTADGGVVDRATVAAGQRPHGLDPDYKMIHSCGTGVRTSLRKITFRFC